ncbi:PilW family protein [Pedobacter sp. AW1-32]|uniref:PilW family protein n=1 Tax=Pedobacter sp. AW1-32 TaxID=3383026 RepID=UPI003FEE7D49
MAKVMREKIESSTLIEVLIAMVIIMVIFSVAMGLFSNVIGSSTSYTKVKAQNQMEVLADEIRTLGYVKENSISIDSVDYQIEDDENAVNGLKKIKIKASQQGRSLGSVQCLIQQNANAEQ